MDTSIAWKEAWRMTGRLQGQEQIPIASISAETWYWILQDFAFQHDGLLGRVPNLFIPIADLMTGNNSYGIQLQVPRGKTVYARGLSPITRVLALEIEKKGTGMRLCEGIPGLWSENFCRYLFLLAPKGEKSLVWATWLVEYGLAVVGQGEGRKCVRTVTSSTSYFLDKETVLNTFREWPGLGYVFLDHIYLGLHSFEAELQKVSALRIMIEQMKYRIRL